MKTLFFILFCTFLTAGAIHAKDLQRPDSENYLKGVEALNEGDTEKAYEYLKAELAQNPENGYAHCYMALICNFSGDVKLAFQAVTRSLDLIPESDTEFRSFAYYTRGMLLKNYHQGELAEADFTEAIRTNPNDVENYTCRAEVLLQLHEYEAALDDLTAALKLDSKADVADLMMQLMEEAPDTGMIDRISATYEMLNNQELSN